MKLSNTPGKNIEFLQSYMPNGTTEMGADHVAATVPEPLAQGLFAIEILPRDTLQSLKSAVLVR